MLRLSKMTDYGTLVLAELARSPNRRHSAAEVADQTGLAAPTVSKLLKNLARQGLVTSVRGAQGGYALARVAREITAAEIIDALEGPVAVTECSDEHGECSLEPVCGVGKGWQKINEAIRGALEGVTLDDLARREVPLKWFPTRPARPGPRSSA